MASYADIALTLPAALPWVEGPGETADLTVTLPGVVPALVTVAGDASVSVTLPGIVPSLTALVNSFAAVDVLLPTVIPTILVGYGQTAAIHPILPAVIPSISAATGRVAAVSVKLPAVIPDLFGFVSHIPASIDLILPAVVPKLVSLGAFHIIVLNPALRGVTEFTNYDFNSVIELEGKLYAFGAAGIYLLGGTTDNGVAIPMSFTLGDAEYGRGQKSKLLDAHLLGRTSGTLQMTVKADDGTAYPYTSIGDTTGNLQNHRFKPGKGIEGVAHRLTFGNVSGSTMEAQEINLLVGESQRKR